ncbi:squalene/phytoene synthase family protein [Leucobacter weissii]|uniref:Squalene/phytoene synthase family protein n=1 Tax=Leucobacter weissii TaxID=1983706 RepID=A0A939MLL1_9MICO|nr:squalene/phytoene synthase family protein [Leucobacter weissii]MBO1902510.1 squalene/phytoene synthase family protein [Leucobacter weissii]
MTGRDASRDPLGGYTAAAERAATRVIGAYSTSFASATRLLGRRHRSHVRNIYALVRVADELVDGVAAQAGLTREQQSRALDRLAEETAHAVACGYSSDLIVHAFARTARVSGIEHALIDPFFASMRADLPQGDGSVGTAGPTAFDAAAHRDYVHGSAEVVGLMCLRVFTREEALLPERRERLEHGARQLGAAFQNVNFLRDLADDTTRLGRSYLSAGGQLSDEDRDRWIATVRAQLADAAASIPLLPADARVAVRAALDLFTALADRISATPATRLYRERIRVPDSTKSLIVARSVLASLRGSGR